MSSASVFQAIMFADISGSSALYKSQGDQQAKAIVDRALAIMLSESQAHSGVLVKTIGDEIMVRFDSSDEALLCAGAIQGAFCKRSELNSLSVRIGLDAGSILLEQNDVFGSAVNDAACIAHIARGNQCILGEHIFNTLSHSQQDRCEEFDRVALKGHQVKTKLYRLAWEDRTTLDNATTVMSLTDITLQLNKNKLKLSYQDQKHAITPDMTPFTLGRDAEFSKLHLTTGLASREHCHIEYRRGKFILVDHSTNGTYISSKNSSELYLRREELPLTGMGTISIGQPQAKSDCILTFSCEKAPQ